jgi:AcrR family transcriptional regulator
MNDMSTGYTDSGRTRQKQRTRDQLLEAARRLIERGDTPRVEEAAEAAGISRTTAYRYFASQAALLAAAFPETAARSLLPDPAPGEVSERVAAVAGALIDRIEETEDQQRAMLRLSLGDEPHELPLRQGRAIGWFTEALEPLRAEYGDESVRRLAIAVRSVCGIETRVWLRDVAGLDAAAVRELQLWTVSAVVERARHDPPPPGRDEVEQVGPTSL